MSTKSTDSAAPAAPAKAKFAYQQFGGVAARVPSPQPGRVSGVDVIGWGKDNLYPNQLNNLYEESPLHGGIINGKVHYTVSGGLKYTGADASKWIEINKNFESDYSIEDSIEEISRDLELYECFAWKGKWRVGGEGVILEHVNFDQLRKGDPDKHEEKTWYYCKDWSDMRKARNAKPYKEFDPAVREGEFIFVYMAKSKQPKERMNGRKLVATPYPFPAYNSGLRSIMTDIEIDKFDLAEVQNGFTAGTHMHFADGIPDEPDRIELEREIRDGQTGADAAGALSITWSDGDSRKPVTITPLMGNNQPERYQNKIKAVADKIMWAHSVTSPLLFGIKTPGQLGGTDELEVGYEIMKANYFARRKKTITEALGYLMSKIYGLQGDFELADVPLGFAKKPEAPTDTPSGAQFSDQIEQSIINGLLKCGKHRHEMTVVQSRAVEDHTQLEKMESELLKAHQFAPELSDTQRAVLKLINDGDSFDSISKALELSPRDLSGVYNSLAGEGLIDIDSGEITPEGGEALTEETPRIEVRYSYEKRADISGPAILPDGRTRDFCATLIRADRFYTREEIEMISSQVDRNVWMFKGGWFHNPETNRNEPYCRHTWVQNLVAL